MTKLPIQISDDCLDALRSIAKQEHRDARQQAAWMLEQELIRLGLIKSKQGEPATTGIEQGGQNAVAYS